MSKAPTGEGFPEREPSEPQSPLNRTRQDSNLRPSVP